MIALLDGPFIRMALVGGLLFCLVASILSPWVVLRRLSYATDALAHATFGGIALALFFGMQGVVDNAGSGKVLLISLAFSLLVSQLLALLMRQSFLSQDAATGIVYAGAFAFGGDIPGYSSGRYPKPSRARIAFIRQYFSAGTSGVMDSRGDFPSGLGLCLVLAKRYDVVGI